MTASAKCGRFNFMECGEFPWGMWFVPRLKGAVYNSYLRSAILCQSEVQNLSKSRIRWAFVVQGGWSCLENGIYCAGRLVMSREGHRSF